MFTLQELEEDPAALIELKEDVREECEKIGEVTNVVLFDAEEDGVMSVRFANEQHALDCVKVCLLPNLPGCPN
jgi:HIV Tat-specific factor 1